MNSPDSVWRDSIVMERLVASPFALDIYGNCGIAQIVQAAQDSLFTQIVYARKYGDEMTPQQKLIIGYQVASGVADLHSIDTHGPSVAHNDLSSGNSHVAWLVYMSCAYV